MIWFAAIAAELVTAIAAFWFLLGHCFSPETYFVTAVAAGSVEVIWLAIATGAAAIWLVAIRRRSDRWPTLARAALPLTLASLVCLGKEVFARPVNFFDSMLFGTCFGWTVALVLASGSNTTVRRVQWLRMAVVASGMGLTVYYVWQQLGFLNDLALGYADCGEIARVMFNTITNPGELFLRANPEKPLFFDHFQPGSLLFVPLWLLWPDVRVTIVMQVVCMLGSAVPLYWIGKRLLGSPGAALLLALAWLVYPSTSTFIYNASYGFRWGNACVPLYLTALALWLHGRPGWALAAAMWAMLIKEEALIVVGMFGLYLALFERKRSTGFLLAAAAFGAFFLVTSTLVSAGTTRHAFMMRFFTELGRTNTEILLAPVNRPRIFWGRIFEPSSFYFAGCLLAPLLWLPLRRPAVLFVGLLTFLFSCFDPVLKSLWFHYQAGLIPVAFWALTAAVACYDAHRQHAVLWGAVAAGLMFSTFWGFTFWSKDTVIVQRSPGRLELVRRFAALIDSNGSLFASQRAAAHFVSQKYLYVEPPMPRTLDYALLDLRDDWREVGSLAWLREMRSAQAELEANPALHLTKCEDGLLLYSRSGPRLDARSLVERAAPPADSIAEDLALGRGVRIHAAQIIPHPGPLPTVEVVTFSEVTAQTNVDLAARCQLEYVISPTETEVYVTRFQPLGEGIWPVSRWQPGKLYCDHFFVAVPAELTGKSCATRFDVSLINP